MDSSNTTTPYRSSLSLGVSSGASTTYLPEHSYQPPPPQSRPLAAPIALPPPAAGVHSPSSSSAAPGAGQFVGVNSNLPPAGSSGVAYSHSMRALSTDPVTGVTTESTRVSVHHTTAPPTASASPPYPAAGTVPPQSQFPTSPSIASHAVTARERFSVRASNLREIEERAVEAESAGRRERENRLQAERERIRAESQRVDSEAQSLGREKQSEQWARRERELRLAAEAALEEAEATALAWDLEAERQEREKNSALQEVERERQRATALDVQLRAERSAREAADHRAANAELAVKEAEARAEEIVRRERQARADNHRSVELSQQRVAELEDQLRKERAARQAVEERLRDTELQAHGMQLANDELMRAERTSRLKAEERAAQAERDATAADDRTRTEASRRAELENALAVESLGRKAAEERLREAQRQSDMDRSAKLAAEARITELAEAYQRERRARMHAETMAHHLDAVAGSERLGRVDAETRARILANRDNLGRSALDKATEPWARQELVHHRVEERLNIGPEEHATVSTTSYTSTGTSTEQKLIQEAKRRLPPARLDDTKPGENANPGTPVSQITREVSMYRRSRSPPATPR
eukprot:TRINITY_DN19258_c0_g1_i1.p1 TRINITY_DN19258_c0_g1~~TRINITY_DN19258_c0_g1_i1.p1  ORF type:complete len:593 (+),score=97.09 TRINITY_DN19258_c0_g1_i1:37-1815(+)